MTTSLDSRLGEPDGPWVEAADWAFRFLFFVVSVIAIGWIFSGLRRVPPDGQAVVFRFGEAVRTQGPGLLLAWPSPVEHVVVLPSPVRQIEFSLPRLGDDSVPRGSVPGGASAAQVYLSGNPRRNTAFFLTGDASIVHLQATIFYQISDPVAYVVAGEHVAPALERLFIASAVATIAGRDLDTVLVARPEAAARPAEAAMRERLRQDLVGAVNRRLAGLASVGAGFGVQVSRVDVAASIPGEAKAAFDHVLTVTQEMQKNIALARTQGELKAQATSQERDRLMSETAAQANEQVNGAKAQTASIEALGEQSYGSSHSMLMQRLYNDRVGALFGKIGHVEAVARTGGMRTILPAGSPPP